MGKKDRKKMTDDDLEAAARELEELELNPSAPPPEEPPTENKKKKKKGKAQSETPPEEQPASSESTVSQPQQSDLATEEMNGNDDIAPKPKSQSQKKKEKREREKLKKLAEKEPSVESDAPADSAPSEPSTKTDAEPEGKEEPEADGKKKKKKGKADKEEDKKAPKRKGPGQKALALMQEALQKAKEEEERFQREEEEKQRQLEELERQREEKKRLEEERKERRKQKEKERKARLKQEGKLLTAKQKQDKARAQGMLEALRERGIIVPALNQEKKPAQSRPNRARRKQEPKTDASNEEQVQLEIVDKESSPEQGAEGEGSAAVKESWDESSDEEAKAWDADDTDEEDEEGPDDAGSTAKEDVQESESVSDESSSEESEDEDDTRTDAEKKREKAQFRIQKRKDEAEKKKDPDVLRSAVICVLGHVDTGKTKILDKLRRTHVQDGEAGGITQQIGATNVPIDAIKEQCKMVKEFVDTELKLPGLLIIDTPGHESFSNLRSRGSSLCDMAILIVDIMHGLEPQTIESINLLKARKTPFIVALNKIDRLYNWKTNSRRDIQELLRSQDSNTAIEFEQRTKEVIVQFAEQSLNAALYYENPDPRSYISMVPTSAITGDGMGNLMALLVNLCQTMIAKKLVYSEELQATVLEVKALPGLGTTIDIILLNGRIREGDTIVVAGSDGPIVTQIRSLLMPHPMQELRVKNQYVEHKEIQAAQGIKICARDLEKALAGLNLFISYNADELEIWKETAAVELKSALSSIKLKERGVYVQASTLGSLEALLEFLRVSEIPYAGIRIGPVVKKDVMKTSIMLEHDSQYAVILAFDVKIERDAQELADSVGVRIFEAKIIYHLFDHFTKFREELKQKKRDEFKHIAVFPCKLKILPQYIFNSRDPIVMGVMVEAGILQTGTPICVPSKEFLEIGTVTSIEVNHKVVETARKGQEVCVKIEGQDTPKMYGRHFTEEDMLVSKISRESIDACKEYFRDDLLKSDWQLMIELKKVFQIM